MFRRAVIALALLVIAAVLSGCSGPQPVGATDPYSIAPGDFALDVTVLRHPDDIRTYTAEFETAWPPAHERPARYVLLPDGSLHHEIDVPIRTSRRPPLTRYVDRRGVAEIWAHCRSLGLADPGDADPRGNLALIQPEAGQVSYLIEITADDERWDFVRTVDPATDDPAVAELVRELATLVWATDDPGPRRAVVPRRYDFGPDPYAMYR